MRTNFIPPPLYGAACAAGMLALARYFPIVELHALVPSLGILFKVIALAMGVLGLVLDGMAVFDFVRRKTTVNPFTPQKSRALVTSGLYRCSRNPMYLGMLLTLCGIALYLGALSGFIALPLFIVVINNAQIKAEERVLQDLFGDEYQQYCRRVRRWL